MSGPQPDDLIGSTRAQVQEVLGPPASISLMRVPDPDLHPSGPRPARIPPNDPVEQWTYHDVAGMTRVLWFAADHPRPVRGRRFAANDAEQAWKVEPTLRETYSYPTGAVV